MRRLIATAFDVGNHPAGGKYFAFFFNTRDGFVVVGWYLLIGEGWILRQIQQLARYCISRLSTKDDLAHVPR